MKKVGKTREALAELVDALFREHIENYDDRYWPCKPEDLTVNRGGNIFNDWCSWTGEIKPRTSDSRRISIASWETMTDLVKRGKLHLVGDVKTIGPIEVS